MNMNLDYMEEKPVSERGPPPPDFWHAPVGEGWRADDPCEFIFGDQVDKGIV